jgi:hypothetical protein
MDSNAQLEKIGMGLVCSLETYKGANIEIVKRLSGFNGLSVYKYGQVRKIEVKTMQRSDKWIAINGTRAIDKLFFEQDYWLYFVLIPENIVLIAKGLPFIQMQMKLNNNIHYLDRMKKLLINTKDLAKETGFQLTLKINVPFSIPIRKLKDQILLGKVFDWEESVIEVWENKSEWNKIYHSEKYIEI